MSLKSVDFSVGKAPAGKPTSWAWFFALLGLLILLRSEILLLPPYEDQAVGLWAEADFLVENHFNYWKLRYDEPHFIDSANGARSYMISILPTLVALLMVAMPSIPLAILAGHLATLALTASAIISFYDLARPMVGTLSASLAAAAVLTTCLFSAQIDQIGMDIPLTTCALWSLQMVARQAWGQAIACSLLAFFVKSTGLLLTCSITGYLLLLASVIIFSGRTRDAVDLFRYAAIGLILIAFEAALIAWGDTTIDQRLSIPWPKAFSLNHGLYWMPDFGVLLLATSVAMLVHLKFFVAALRQDLATTARWIIHHAVAIIALLVIAGIVLAMRRYIFIPRYATLAIPLCYLVVVSALHLAPREGRIGLAVDRLVPTVLTAIVLFQVWNQNARCFPSIASVIEKESPSLSFWHARMCAFTERSREYLLDHRSALQAIRLLESKHSEAVIFADMPYYWYLTKPRLGYVAHAFAQVVKPSSLAQTMDAFRKALPQNPEQPPIFIYAPRSRVYFPAPGPFTRTLYRDDLSPPLIVYQVRPNLIPKTDRRIEDWYLEQAWAKDLIGQRALYRLPFLLQTDRYQQGRQEIEQALLSTPADSFVYPFLEQQKESFLRKASDGSDRVQEANP